MGKIFGLKRDEVTRGSRKLHNDELQNLYSSPNIIKTNKSINKMGVEFSTHGEDEKHVDNLVGRPEGKISFRRTQQRCEQNLADLRKTR